MYRIILCSFALFSLTACALGVVQREVLTPDPTIPGSTAVPPATATFTPMPTDVTQPTPTTPSEPAPVATPVQIRFSPGATSATIEGSLATCDDSDSYRLAAMGGQTMHVTVTSPEDEAIVAVTRQLPDGTWEPMVRSHFLETSVDVFLPATGTYDIDILRRTAVAGDCSGVESTAVNYTLVVEIPPLPSPVEGLTLETLKNAEYQIPGEEPFQLEDGIHYLPPLPPDEPPENWTITLVEPVAFGDVDGDGAEDGVVILNAHYGGTGVFKYVAVVLNRDGQPYNVASTFLGDRTVINAIDILPSGEIHVDAIVHGPEDPLCCPSQPQILRFQLVGEELVDLDGD